MSDFNEVFERNYELRKIILVNSASHAYSEIPIGQSLALFGKNNRGKTSSLAATKLLLYPETDLTKCESKFNFTNKGGETYSKEESYKHYFPIADSFVIVEVLNPKNIFTMLLYRVGNYEYHRLFFPVPYSEIKHLIWNEDTNYFSDDIGLASLIKAQKEMGGIQVTSKAELQKIMYGNFGSKNSEYCVVPIKDQKESSVQSFIKMYELAFDSGKGEKEKLPNAIATIIEMQRGRDNERLDENVHDLKDKRTLLAAEGLKIKSLIDNEGAYQKIQTRFDALHKEAHTAVLNHSVFNHLLAISKEEYAVSSTKVANEKARIEGERSVLVGEIGTLSRLVSGTSAQIESLTKDIASTKNKQIAAQTILGLYPNLTTRQVVDKMEIEKAEKNQMATAIKDKEKTGKLMTDKSRQCNSIEKKIKQLGQSLNNHQLLIANQLPPLSANILGSINSSFLRISTDRLVTDGELKSIGDFTDLFLEDNGELSFLGSTLQDAEFKKYDAQEQQIRIKEEIEREKERLGSTKAQLDQLNKALASSDIQNTENTEQGLYKEVNALVNNIQMLEGLGLLSSQLTEKSLELTEKQERLDTSNVTLASKRRAEQFINSQYQQVLTEHAVMEAFNRDAVTMSNMVSSDRHINGLPYISADSQEFITLLESGTLEININTASSIADSLRKCQIEVASLTNSISEFTRLVVIEGIDPNIQLNSLNDLSDTIKKYRNSFDTLEWQQKSFKNEIKAHNNIIDGLLKEITDAAGLLRNTVASLNNRLNEHKISNLEKVALRLNLSPDFASLESTYRKHDAEQTSLLDEDFYQSLIYYVEKSSWSNSKRLKIRNLISSIDYEYTSKSGEKEGKGQSGGTTGTITALIATLLFSEVFLKHSNLKMPIIVDEVASIDKDNIKTIVKYVTEAGFVVICASPAKCADALRHIPRYMYVDKSVLKGTLMSKDCEFNLMPKDIALVAKEVKDDSE